MLESRRVVEENKKRKEAVNGECGASFAQFWVQNGRSDKWQVRNAQDCCWFSFLGRAHSLTPLEISITAACTFSWYFVKFRISSHSSGRNCFYFMMQA